MGRRDFYDPLTGLDVPAAVRAKMKFVGFLQRSLSHEERPDHLPQGDYILVTTGGGGDGAELIHDVIHAYQQDPELTHKALVVLGPYMPAKKRRKLIKKGGPIPFLEMIEFDNRMEELIAGATGGGGDGRLQHLLRDPVLRQAGADRAQSARRARSS